MARSFSSCARHIAAAASIAAVLTGCARTEVPVAAGGVASAIPVSQEHTAPVGEPPVGTPALQRRKQELLNPDGSTMVLLYYDLAGIPAPIDQWLDDDMRVRLAPASQKPAARNLVRQELESAIKSVKDVGSIRLSMHANLSEYDATYGEFTVRALAPSSVVEFKALGQKVALKFGNARSAQTWRVPATQAQGVRDRIGFSSDVSIDALLQIHDVHAAPEGGTITTHVIEYELRENRGGTLLGRVQLAQQP
jgi:hypothetical protein